MGEHVLPGNPPVPLLLRRSSRARRISLRVSRLDGRVTLTLPHGVPEAEALAFAREKAAWLRDALAQRPENVAVGFGTELPLEGRPVTVIPGPGRAVRLNGDHLEVPGAPAQAARRAQAFLKDRARARLSAASDRYAAALGRPYTRLTLRDTRSRWGSCSSDGRLMFSWRLILAPPDVLDYVAAHEVAHLAHMDHSRAFWETTRRLFGPWEAQRRWLRTHGGDLHRYRFGD